MAITLSKVLHTNVWKSLTYCSNCTAASQRSDVSIKCHMERESRICPIAAKVNEKNKLINGVNKVSGDSG